MNNCFYAAKPLDCEYHPGCSRDHIYSYDLAEGETRHFRYPGPCLVYLHQGECEVNCNKYLLTDIAAPDFLIVPDLGFHLRSLNPAKVFIFGPDLVRLLADKLGADYYQNRFGGKKNLKPVRLLRGETALRQSHGIMTEYLDCRHYAQHKFHEIIHVMDPAAHKAIGRVLVSKYWFFRIQVKDLLRSCGSMEEFSYVMGLSDSGFSKAFKKAFGQSFYSWFLDRKFEAVVNDFIRSELTLKEISEKHAFNSAQHLGYFIKKRTGIPAGMLRDKLKSGGESSGSNCSNTSARACKHTAEY